MPTTLALAGIDPPEHVEFQNLLPLLDGEASRYEAIYGSYLQLQRSVRTEQHKLIVYPAVKVVRLFDLEKDPYERNDLAGEMSSRPQIRQLLAQLLAQLLDLQRQFDDPLELAADISDWLEPQR